MGHPWQMRWRYSVRSPKITLSNGCLAFLCAYCVFDPRGTFLWFLFSVVCHEIGHLLAMRIMGIPVLGIRGTLGGLEILAPPLTYKQEIPVALSGPLMNLLLFDLTRRIYPLMSLMNGVLLLYNLLPIYPLDGGRALRAGLHCYFPLHIAERIERFCGGGVLLSILVGCLYLAFTYQCGMWPILFCAFLFYRLGETILPKEKNTLDKIKFP